MKLLAFDCSGKKTRVFVQNEDNECCIEREDCSGTETLLVLVDEALASVGMKIGDVQTFAIGVGPGSWTGSRVCVSTALGFLSAIKNPQIKTFSAFDLVESAAACGGETWDLLVVPAYANFVFSKSISGEMACATKNEIRESVARGKTVVGEYQIFDNQKVVDVDFGACVKDIVCKKTSVGIDALEPIYLKLSQAEEQLKKKREIK